MRLRWTPAAAADLEHIHDYLGEHRPQVLRSTIRRVYDGIRSLKTFPHLGRPGREEGTRELVFVPLPYVAVYRLKDDVIEILHIHHGARQWP